MEKSRGTIALDFDDVLLETDVIERTLVENGIDPESVTGWDMKGAPPEVIALISQRFHDPSYMCDETDLIPESVQAVKRLARLGYRLIVVTSRASELEEPTKALIKKHMPDVDDVFLVGLGGSKVDVLLREKAILLCDDAPHNIEAAEAAGIPFVLISNIRTLHNHALARKLRRRVGTKLVAASLAVVVSWFLRRNRPTVSEYQARCEVEA